MYIPVLTSDCAGQSRMQPYLFSKEHFDVWPQRVQVPSYLVRWCACCPVAIKHAICPSVCAEPECGCPDTASGDDPNNHQHRGHSGSILLTARQRLANMSRTSFPYSPDQILVFGVYRLVEHDGSISLGCLLVSCCCCSNQPSRVPCGDVGWHRGKLLCSTASAPAPVRKGDDQRDDDECCRKMPVYDEMVASMSCSAPSAYTTRWR